MVKESSIDNSSESQRILTGYSQLDSENFRILSKDLIVLGGDVTMGKTQFALDLALKIAKNYPVLYVSLKETENVIVSRILSCFSGINWDRIMTNELAKEEKKFLSSFSNFEGKLYVSSEFSSVKNLVSKINQFGFKMVFVDDLQMLKLKYSKMELSLIINELKTVANDNNMVIFLLSQLSKKIEKKNPLRIPSIYHLNVNNAVRQIPDKIWFLYRPEHYLIEEDNDSERSPTKDLVKLLVVKNRNGKTGICYFEKASNFSSFKQRFETHFNFDMNYSSYQNEGISFELDNEELPF